MKKILFTSLLVMAVTFGAMAKDTKKVNMNILNTFTTEYANASNVNWTVNHKFAKASFLLDGKKQEVFYSINGEYIGTSTPAFLHQLPGAAKRTLSKKFAGYALTELIKFEGVEENAFYLSAENSKEKIVVRIGDNSSVSIFDRQVKKS